MAGTLTLSNHRQQIVWLRFFDRPSRTGIIGWPVTDKGWYLSARGRSCPGLRDAINGVRFHQWRPVPYENKPIGVKEDT